MPELEYKRLEQPAPRIAFVDRRGVRLALRRGFKIALSTIVLVAAVAAQLHYGIGITFSVIAIGLLLWYVVQPKNKIPLQVLLLAVTIIALSLIERQWFKFVDRMFPMKYDHVLAGIDQRWFFDGSACKRFVDAFPILARATVMIYEGTALSLAFWLGWLLVAHGPAAKFTKGLLLTYAVGPLFYLLVPACGPLYAGPGAGTSLILLHGYPNCMPSLHLTTALLLIFFRPGRSGLLFGILFTLATAFVTLATGQHYVVDLVIAVPFAGFIWASIEGRKYMAATLLLTVLCATVLIHLA